MSSLKVGLVGFDITPRFHPTCGAWGCTPNMTELDMPLLARCIALDQAGRRVIWFGSDLVGETVKGTDAFRDEIADALDLRRDQIVWSTSQTHSSGAVPGSVITGCNVRDLSRNDPEFMAAERKRFMNAYVESARRAIAELQPARIWAGRGFCDSMSYNTRLPMPNGGVKFSRHHGEGLQSGKPFDTTIGLVRFESVDGKTLGAIFNFCSHPATMINDRMISPDWVGTARQHIEAAIDGAPAMFVQGFCGDVNCHHIFGTPDMARRTGMRLGKAAVEALPTLIPVRSEPLALAWQTIDIECKPMPSRSEMEAALAARQAYIDELKDDLAATWYCGANAPDQFSADDKARSVLVQMDYFREGVRRIDAGESTRRSLWLTLGALRMGDLAAALAPGENFTQTGMNIRARSPFVHTLVCGDTNGLFGYIGTDDEIDRGGYETDTYWTLQSIDGFRLAPAKGSAGRIVEGSLGLLRSIAAGR